MENKYLILSRALKANGFDFELFNSSADLVTYLQSILPPKAITASGSSVTLDESGVRTLLSSGDYVYYDSSQTTADRSAVIRSGILSNYYFTSVAAVTMDGQLLMVDGTGNRIAAVSCGAGQVYIIAGRNKIVNNFYEALERLRTVAAPKNAVRRGKSELPCASLGYCLDCKSLSRMCCYYLKLSFTREKGRFHICIVDEDLGF